MKDEKQIRCKKNFPAEREVRLLLDLDPDSGPVVSDVLTLADEDDLRAACEAVGLVVGKEVLPTIENMVDFARCDLAADVKDVEGAWNLIHEEIQNLRECVNSAEEKLGPVEAMRDAAIARAEKAEAEVEHCRAEASVAATDVAEAGVDPGFVRQANMMAKEHAALRAILSAREDESLYDAAMTTLDTLEIHKARYKIGKDSYALLQLALSTGLEECERLRGEVEAVTERAKRADARLGKVVDAASAAGWDGIENPKSLWDFVTRLAEERDDLRTKLAASEAAHTKSLDTIREAYRLLTGKVGPHLLEAVKMAVAERTDLESCLAALTAPVEGEPTIGTLISIRKQDPDSPLLLSVWRHGHAAGMAKAERDAEAAAKDAAIQAMHESSDASGKDEDGLTVGDRWEQGVPHDPRSVAILESISKIDAEQCNNYFDWRVGGDGDNGEELMYALDVHFASVDARAEVTPPRDLPRATDEELIAMLSDDYGQDNEKDHNTAAVLAIAERLRRERCDKTEAERVAEAADLFDAEVIRARTDASLRPIVEAIESSRARAEEILGGRAGAPHHRSTRADPGGVEKYVGLQLSERRRLRPATVASRVRRGEGILEERARAAG